MLTAEFEVFRHQHLRWFDPWFFKDELEFLDLEPNSDRAIRVVQDLDQLNIRFGLNRKIAERLKPQLLTVWRQEKRPPRIIDLCGGFGGFARYLIQWAKHTEIPIHLTVLDISSAAIQVGQRAVGSDEITWQVGDATQLNYPDQAFDLALNIQSLHHFDPGSVVKLLQETSRISTSFFFFDIKRSPLGFLFVQLLRPFFGQELIHDGLISYRRAYTLLEMAFLLEQADVGGIIAPFLPVGLSISHGL